MEEYSRSRTLRLPEGYTIEPTTDDARSSSGQLLVLKRTDGSAVARFEFSAFGPGPQKIWELAVEDAENIALGKEV